ncbi:hypothetical protein FEM48_Zijuj07G0109000 [Ziziphus jujuba var. spinosa]|uniref:Glu S.griseus protease inhibitor-like n=1 Tax=Ziziphus jujuba var. spinosa TaxID=714518 RepID=A0A978V479_ZIZJJ|nr:hypothetical protein FEM48_Zijuj07G0109000 [Ziziphus jujuba var. spinosa]
MASSCPGKNSWPELLGTEGKAAVEIIERENPNVKASIVLEGSFVTADIRCDRVRVWVNTNGIIISVPNVR